MCVVLMRPWCDLNILGGNDLFSQNVGFSPFRRLTKVRLVGCDQQWISERAVSMNWSVDSHGYSGRLSVFFFLNRKIFNHNFCRSSSQVDVEEWESLLWIFCTFTGQRICLVIGVRQIYGPDSRLLILLYIFPKPNWEEGVKFSIVV